MVRGQAAWARRALTAAGVLALVLLGTAPPTDWSAALEAWRAMPWGGPLWWLLRTAMALAVDVF